MVDDGEDGDDNMVESMCRLKMFCPVSSGILRRRDICWESNDLWHNGIFLLQGVHVDFHVADGGQARRGDELAHVLSLVGRVNGLGSSRKLLSHAQRPLGADR